MPTDQRFNGTNKINLNALPIVRKENSILVLLPKLLWREAGKCSCPYCKGRMGYWDTVVIPLVPDRERDWTYTVHYPELHGARK